MTSVKAWAKRSLHPTCLLALLLTLGSSLLYWNTSAKFKDSAVYERQDVFFRSDSRRVYNDLILKREASHSNTSAHPTFVLFHQPLGFTLANWVKSQNKGMPIETARRYAARSMTVAAGALCVTGFFVTLLTLGLCRTRAALFSALFACSNTAIFFASIPETYVFSALGLIAIASHAIHRPSTHEGWWLASSLYAIGNLTSSVVQVGIWSLCRYAGQGSNLTRVLWHSLRSGLIAVLLLISLSLVQKAIYPSTTLFFLPKSVVGQSAWLTWENLKTPLHTSGIVLQHLIHTNIVAPQPVRTTFNGQPMGSIEKGTWDTLRPAFPLHAAWSLILLGGIGGLCRRSALTPPVLAALGCLLFSALFFAVFGNDRMLYSAIWTPFTLLLVAAGWETWLRTRPQLALGFAALLPLFILAQAIHHWRFLDTLLALVT